MHRHGNTVQINVCGCAIWFDHYLQCQTIVNIHKFNMLTSMPVFVCVHQGLMILEGVCDVILHVVQAVKMSTIFVNYL